MTELSETRVLKEADHATRGNRVLLYGEGGGARVLKIFRRRRSALREFLGEMAARIVHRKRGVDVRSRFETERAALEVWRRHGFDVLRTFDEPLPDGVRHDAIWYEYCPGRRLSEILADGTVAWEEKAALLRRLGSETDRRHGAALEHAEPLLVQEYGSIKHFLVWKERLIAFDFEGGYGPRFPLQEALAGEVSDTLKSVSGAVGGDFERGLDAWLGGYASRDRLARIAEWGTSGRGFLRLAKRLAAVVRRREREKIGMLRRLGDVLRKGS
ncbi:MAG: hypothetical protein ACYTAF_00305 [Planctomycetota bacterium]|jgi:hypothetical protein